MLYRPFVATNCYLDYTFVERNYDVDRIVPLNTSENRAICVNGTGARKEFTALIINTIPDYQLNLNGECFPRYLYPKPAEAEATIQDRAEIPGDGREVDRIDNISDTAMRAFHEHYRDDTITKDAIFGYVYGILHAPSYREEFANDLAIMLPRIPFAPDFQAFAKAGRALAERHLGYETCEQYPLDVVFAHKGEPQPHHFKLTEKAMHYGNDEKTTLIINEHVGLTGIPAEAHRYVVNGRTPLEWYIDCYKITTDTESGIVNDPNGWFTDPLDLVAAIKRIVHVSVESARIIEGLPSVLTDCT